MLRKTTKLLVILVVLAFCGYSSAIAQETTQSEVVAAEELIERAQNTVAILQPLLDLEAGLQDQITALNAAGSEDEATTSELERLQAELDDVQEQISLVVTGVSERHYRSLDQTQFDLNQEVQNLLEPFVLILNEATNDARELERTRRNLDIAMRRIADTDLAIMNIEAGLSQVSDAAIIERLEKDLAIWQERQVVHNAQVDALTQRITDLHLQRGSVGRNVNSAFQVFFRDRGISLLLGVGAFLAVLIASRVLIYIAERAIARANRERTFAIRLAGVLFGVFSIFGSFAAMLIVFNMRNDWLLLGLSVLLLLAVLWVTIRMLPSLIEQLSVLLNLGAVQENERVLFNGVPFKVQRLSFFTDLVNPALDGGEFTLPVRELVSMHSRPAATDEAWFPSEKGDWVRLADGNAGQVVAQTPEMVVVQHLGGARTTYQTPDYLSATPENLSHGFRAEIEFGIGYRHQTEATNQIIDIMRKGVLEHFKGLLEPDQIRSVDIEFLRTGASSLDFEVEIDVAGSAAHRFEEIERELARCLVNLANTNNWEIPFQQIVVHNPSD